MELAQVCSGFNAPSAPSIDLTPLIAVNNTIAANTAKGLDNTRAQSLTGSFAALTAEACKSVLLINATNAVVNFTCNGGSSCTLPIGAGLILSVPNASLISVKGAGELSYILNL